MSTPSWRPQRPADVLLDYLILFAVNAPRARKRCASRSRIIVYTRYLTQRRHVVYTGGMQDIATYPRTQPEWRRLELPPIVRTRWPEGDRPGRAQFAGTTDAGRMWGVIEVDRRGRHIRAECSLLLDGAMQEWFWRADGSGRLQRCSMAAYCGERTARDADRLASEIWAAAEKSRKKNT